jgi:hypothetical protein
MSTPKRLAEDPAQQEELISLIFNHSQQSAMVHATSLAATIGLLLIVLVMIATAAGPLSIVSRFYCEIAVLGGLFASWFFALRVIVYNGKAKEIMANWPGKNAPSVRAAQNPVFVVLAVFAATFIAACAFGALRGWLPPYLPSVFLK